MFRVLRSLVLPATVLLVLSGCASIQSRDLPKCSGNDRRPMNADLWNWDSTTPDDAGGLMKPYAPIPSAKPAGVQAIEAMNNDGEPRWNVAASEEPCV